MNSQKRNDHETKGEIALGQKQKRFDVNGLMDIHFFFFFGFFRNLFRWYAKSIAYVKSCQKSVAQEECARERGVGEATPLGIRCEHADDKQEFMHTSGVDVSKKLLQKHN